MQAVDASFAIGWAMCWVDVSPRPHLGVLPHASQPDAREMARLLTLPEGPRALMARLIPWTS